MPVERRSLRWVAAIVAVSGFLRLTGPGAAPAPRPTEPTKRQAQPVKRATSSYLSDVERTVRQFFRNEKLTEENADAPWSFPIDPDGIRFVFAILPDPAHTHLGLLFDRAIEAIQQAAQRQGYVFDRAILPWDRSPHQDSDLEKRQKEIDEQRVRESYPGLLLFREGLDLRSRRMAHEPAEKESDPSSLALSEEPLFVLIVGETPTGGLRSFQFRQALDVARLIRGKELPKDKPLLIMGPSFSGSLESLDRELIYAGIGQPYVFSGTITDESSIHWFESQKALKDGRFVSFQQNDRYLIQRFVDFVCAQSYEVGEIAILSEDTTVYGNNASQSASDLPEHHLAQHLMSRRLTGLGQGLRFPRPPERDPTSFPA